MFNLKKIAWMAWRAGRWADWCGRASWQRDEVRPSSCGESGGGKMPAPATPFGCKRSGIHQGSWSSEWEDVGMLPGMRMLRLTSIWESFARIHLSMNFTGLPQWGMGTLWEWENREGSIVTITFFHRSSRLSCWYLEGSDCSLVGERKECNWVMWCECS